MSNVILDKKRVLQIDAAALTSCGQQRTLNQDVVFCQTGQTDRGQNVGLYLVCDGMGGHKAGRVASQLAAGTVMAKLAELFSPTESSVNDVRTQPSPPTLDQLVRSAVQAANREIRDYAREHPQKASNMGTTITLALVYGTRAYVANVGDSRAYVWRAGQITQITQDHSLVAELVKLGIIDESEATTHSQRNVLFRALGMEFQVEVDLFEWELQAGDKLLLCSDGLWQAYPNPAELADWLGSEAKSVELCQQLVTEANQRDGSDNISTLVIRVNEVSSWHLRIVNSVANLFREVATLAS